MGIENKNLNTANKVQDTKEVREQFFSEIVRAGVLDSVLDALEEAGFTKEQTDEFQKSLLDLPVADQSSALSVPHELRHRRFERLHELLQSGTPMAAVVQSLADDARKHGYSLGYHVSNAEIHPQEMPDGREVWCIDGREPDHRDSDLPMAYYSTNLKTMYSKKRARFLYVVRAVQGDETTHKQDNNGAWGRAGKLDIVQQYDLDDLLREVDRRVLNKRNGQNE